MVKTNFQTFFAVFQIFTEIKYVSENMSDLLSFVEASLHILTTTVTCSKIITFYISKREFYQIADQLEKLATVEKDEIIMKQVKRINIMKNLLDCRRDNWNKLMRDSASNEFDRFYFGDW